jgi:hypothetical protein
MFFSHTLPTIFSAHDLRKKKAVHKTTTTDDKRLQSTLKRIGVNAIPAIEEVNIFKDDVVIQFINPKGDANLQYVDHLFLSPRYPSPCNTDKYCCLIYFSVQASIAANTWVVSGSPQTKRMLSLLSIFEDLYNRQSFLVCLFQCFNSESENISGDFYFLFSP